MTRLAPAEYPGNSAYRGFRQFALAPVRRPRTDIHQTDLAYRRGFVEVFEEAPGMVGQVTIALLRQVG